MSKAPVRQDPYRGLVFIVDEIKEVTEKANGTGTELERAYIERRFDLVQRLSDELTTLAHQQRAMTQVLSKQIAALRQREPQKANLR